MTCTYMYTHVAMYVHVCQACKSCIQYVVPHVIFLHLLYLGVLRRQIELKLKHGYYTGPPTAIPAHSNTVLYNTHSGYPTLSLICIMSFLM